MFPSQVPIDRYPHVAVADAAASGRANCGRFRFRSSNAQSPLSSRDYSTRSGDSAHIHVNSKREEVVIAMGANVGDRVQNFNRALKLMRESGLEIRKHACLYETVPMHFEEQPLFLNSAVSCMTDMDPHTLLRVLKGIEQQLGRREVGIKYGPRPMDLDIIFYGSLVIRDDENLQIPHPMFHRRPFVLAPLVDLHHHHHHQQQQQHWSEVGQVLKHWNEIGGEECVKQEGMKRVFPVRGKLLNWCERTHIMGILNVTPDSFSDGGKFIDAENAVKHVDEMVAQGADLIDVGAQSTRPNANRISTQEELDRLVPVLQGIAQLPERDRFILSVDTFDSQVAREAVAAGADMINDVSAGNLDPEMLRTISELEVPCVLMHMRGDPTTMLNQRNTRYDNLNQGVAGAVASELCDKLEQAEMAGIPSWRIIADPGFGFSKVTEQNVELLAGLRRFKQGLRRRRFNHVPVLAGLSRKGFLGALCRHAKGEERDMATVAAATIAILNGANIIRAHNVRAVRDAAMVADAVGKYMIQEETGTDRTHSDLR